MVVLEEKEGKEKEERAPAAEVVMREKVCHSPPSTPLELFGLSPSRPQTLRPSHTRIYRPTQLAISEGKGRDTVPTEGALGRRRQSQRYSHHG
jgi:hypothetical protein